MKFDIGKFKIKSGQVVIGDPYHTHLIDAKINIFDVKKGLWNSRIRKSSDGTIAELIALHKNINFNTDDTEFYWEETENTVEVDSEVVGIFDVDSFCDEETLLDVDTSDVLESGDNKWINYCLTKSLQEPKASVIPNGVITAVNTNNDFYDIFTITDTDGQIVGFKIQFLTEYDEFIPEIN